MKSSNTSKHSTPSRKFQREDGPYNWDAVQEFCGEMESNYSQIVWLWRKMRANDLDDVNQHYSNDTHCCFYSDQSESQIRVMLEKRKLYEFTEFAKFREYVETEVAIQKIY